MTANTTVRRMVPAEATACLAIARRLTDHFDASGLVAMAADLGRHGAWVAVSPAGVRGFLVAAAKGPAVVEVLWIAVDPDVQGRGVGTGLLETALGEAASHGRRLAEVKTLAPTAAWPPYERTRRFYERHGFLLLDIVDPYPGWDPGNPCAIYVRALCPARRAPWQGRSRTSVAAGRSHGRGPAPVRLARARKAGAATRHHGLEAGTYPERRAGRGASGRLRTGAGSG